jgi:hypothetical protein
MDFHEMPAERPVILSSVVTAQRSPAIGTKNGGRHEE